MSYYLEHFAIDSTCIDHYTRTVSEFVLLKTILFRITFGNVNDFFSPAYRYNCHNKNRKRRTLDHFYESCEQPVKSNTLQEAVVRGRFEL